MGVAEIKIFCYKFIEKRRFFWVVHSVFGCLISEVRKKENFDKIIIVSGDGDYKMLIDFLIEEKRFEKILFPDSRYASSLYKKLGSTYFDYLDLPDIRSKIEVKKEKGSLGS